MNLQSWAEQLLHVPSPPEVIDLHTKDTLAAFLTGMATSEGHALGQHYRGRGDTAERAAAAAAIARLSECDDIHLASCVTPGSVVIPVALVLAGERGGEEFNRAIAMGYAAGLSLGVGIGGARALEGGVWPTFLAAPLMAAVAASRLSGHDPGRLAHAMALSLAGASGRPGRPVGARSGRWFVLAEAVAKGIRASEAAGQGFQGDLALLSKPWLAAQAGHDDVDTGVFESSASAPSIDDVGFKPFPIARQGANAVAAFQRLLSNGLDPHGIDSIEVFVPSMNLALLTRPVLDDDRLSRLCNIGFQLACAALAPEMLYDAERAPAAALTEFAQAVSVAAAHDLDTHLPDRWAAKVAVNSNGNRLEQIVIRAPFDHDARDLRQRLNDKWRRLLAPHELSALDGLQAAVWHTTNFWQWLENVGRL